MDDVKIIKIPLQTVWIKKQEEIQEKIKQVENIVKTFEGKKLGTFVTKSIKFTEDGRVLATIEVESSKTLVYNSTNEDIKIQLDEKTITISSSYSHYFINTENLFWDEEGDTDYLEKEFDTVEEALEWLRKKEEEIVERLEELAKQYIAVQKAKQEFEKENSFVLIVDI